MTRSLQVVYEKGVLRPLEPLPFKEHQQVTVTVSDQEEGIGWTRHFCATSKRKLMSPSRSNKFAPHWPRSPAQWWKTSAENGMSEADARRLP
jgi:predicted DNA-binding antitoxin AbrB/MazE fold protein